VANRCWSDCTHPARSVRVRAWLCVIRAELSEACVCEDAAFILSTTHTHTHTHAQTHTHRRGVISISRPHPPGTRHMVQTSLKRPRGSRDQSICKSQKSLYLSLSPPPRPTLSLTLSLPPLSLFVRKSWPSVATYSHACALRTNIMHIMEGARWLYEFVKVYHNCYWMYKNIENRNAFWVYVHLLQWELFVIQVQVTDYRWRWGLNDSSC